MGASVVTAILLDTNALLWLISTPGELIAAAGEALADPGNELIVSARLGMGSSDRKKRSAADPGF